MSRPGTSFPRSALALQLEATCTSCGPDSFFLRASEGSRPCLFNFLANRQLGTLLLWPTLHVDAWWGPMVTLEDANRATSAALSRAKELSARICVTVCDSYGRLIAHQRMDGAFAEASTGSIGKAIAAAEGRSPSGSLPLHPRTGIARGEGLPDISRQGGLPIIRNGEVEGAIGVAGGLTDEQDEECARAALASLKAAP
jgi:glc operon protein GlcG